MWAFRKTRCKDLHNILPTGYYQKIIGVLQGANKKMLRVLGGGSCYHGLVLMGHVYRARTGEGPNL